MKKRYLVVGSLPVGGAQPGEEFSYTYLPHEEKALIEGGAIEPVDAKSESDKPKEK